MKIYCSEIVLILLVLFTSLGVNAKEIYPKPADTETYVVGEKEAGCFTLSENGFTAAIVISSEDFDGVKRVTHYFQEDVRKVTGVEPALFENEIPDAKELIIVGTIGHSPLIDNLISTQKINVDDIAGKWETSLTQVVDNPFPGVDKALVIAGSDKRGTIYGIFELSKQIGVSPWYWWADVPVKKQTNIYIKKGRYVLGEPKVKYRGIFLNDEEPALGRWAVKNYGGFTHDFYEKVFELILRLKGNYLWPAMWWASFNSDDPQNPVLADEMGIVMGTTHHEPMVRAHAEWKPWGGKEWNYETNPEQLREFWREGIERMDDHETIVTVGMRGDGDMEMSEETNIELLQRIIADQRKIIEDVTQKPAGKTPQLWAIYKEVQEYYDKGMRVPDDITLLFCDDNWGNVRKLPDPDAPKREGGYGMYYHFDFVGGPRNYKWLNTSPLPRVWEQLHLTYQHGVDRIWLVNVGDLKPMELPISFFLDYAWNPDAWPVERLYEYTTEWAEQQFGEQYAPEIAKILDLYTKYNGRRTPELLYSDTYSLDNYREFETIVRDYNTIKEQAKDIYEKLDDNQKDAFYQLVYHPVLACANLNELYYSHALNIRYAAQGRSATNDMAAKVEELFRNDAEITEYYHNELAGGKWDHMMAQTHIGYDNWQQPPRNVMPPVKRIELPVKSEMRIALDGSSGFWQKENGEAVLSSFDSWNEQSFCIEIFNAGTEAFNFDIKPAEDWIKLSKSNGTVTKQQRVDIQIEWEKLAAGFHQSYIEIESDTDQKVRIIISARKYEADLNPKGFLERNGYVSMEASDYSDKRDGDGIKWFVIPGLGRTGSGISTFPVIKSLEEIGANTPMLEYDFFLLETPANDTVEVQIYLAPTLNFKNGEGLKFAVSVDNENPEIINIHEGTEVPDWEYPKWFNDAVSNKVMVRKLKLKVTDKGAYTLKLWMIDNGIVFQKIVIDNGGLKASYLGPPESLKL